MHWALVQGYLAQVLIDFKSEGTINLLRSTWLINIKISFKINLLMTGSLTIFQSKFPQLFSPSQSKTLKFFPNINYAGLFLSFPSHLTVKYFSSESQGNFQVALMFDVDNAD